MADGNEPRRDDPTQKYVLQLGTIKSFLFNFKKAGEDGAMVHTYNDRLQQIVNRKARTLDIEVDDLKEHLAGSEDESLVDDVCGNTMRYVNLFAEAADSLMEGILPNAHVTDDVYDMLNKTRREQHAANMAHQQQSQGAAGAPIDTSDPSALESAQNLPAALTRRYDVYIHPPSAQPTIAMRAVNSKHVGKLVKVRGLVTQVTDVKPLAAVITYTDETSGYEIYQEVTGRTFMPLDGPDVKMPDGSKRITPPVMQTKGSRFVKFQEARIQEVSTEVPEGDTPRTMALHLRGEVTRTLKAGDEVTISGVFMPEPFTGWKAMRAGLLTSTYVEVMGAQQMKAAYAVQQVTPAQVAAIEELGRQGNVFERLAASIAPEIFGHREVKKALLLQMVGGVTRSFPDGMKLRGDIHVCLMGDPGVAKSQLLKYIAKVAPRAVYTTGKGSSGVGLTAAVLRNQVTKELVLEGGALVLADKGVCCIDEFDKMDESDRTYIHEVMEQQTVSIAKAGITTTLNTRTTILAAANPSYGRWNHKKSPSENINMPPALLSRFDIMWLILDKAEEDHDRRLAEHILRVHQGQIGNAPEGLRVVPPDVLRAYITLARRQEPFVPPELGDYICSSYVQLRARERGEEEELGVGQARMYVTPRTLMSILRLSQAVAKLRFDDTVSRGDVDEALTLMRSSQSSIEPDVEKRVREDPISRIYNRVRDWAMRQQQSEVPMDRIQELVLGEPNVTTETIMACISDYENIAVWTAARDASGSVTAVRFDEQDILGGV